MRLQITEPETGVGGEGGGRGARGGTRVRGRGERSWLRHRHLTPAPWPVHPQPLKNLGVLQGSGTERQRLGEEDEDNALQQLPAWETSCYHYLRPLGLILRAHPAFMTLNGKNNTSEDKEK